MRLLNSNLEFRDFDDSPPPYAVLSHTWSEKNEEEVTYQDLKEGTVKSLDKVERCRDWAKAAKFEYFWIDTCCIDKRNDAELNYAIRSMWRWYAEAGICFVYLSDLSKKRARDSDWPGLLKDCRWFKRGWTLQELVAPKKVEFYARDGDYLGTKEDLLPELKSITGIDIGGPLPGHATRLSWVTERITKRPEDKAYCMLGICDVSIDPRYGEGKDLAWSRLRDAIARRHGTIALEVHGKAMNDDHRAAVLEALRFNALETRRTTVKVALRNTCKWILSHPACAKWLRLEQKFFWIKGKPGAGKSVLIKYLDQHVTRSLKHSNAIKLHFYFNARGQQLEKSFLGLYRSLLVQLVDLVPELAHELDVLDIDFNLLQLQSVLTSAILGVSRPIWLFIDALDECREGDVQELVEFLVDLEAAELYVCFASRHYPVHRVPTNLQLVLEQVPEHNQDLSTYVEKLDLEGEELAQMQCDIVAKANGIFLWVVLVVGLLQKDVERARFHAMRSRLREIPEGLPDLFKTIILRDDEHREEFLLCLRWILYAWRPLTLKEWYFAMMAGVGGCLEWNEAVTNHRMETFLLSSSKGLAELTKSNTVTAQFIHESVRDFLINDGGFGEICGDHEGLECTAHEQLKHCCLRGLAFDPPTQPELPRVKKQLLTEEQRNGLKATYPFAEYATVHILHHADQAAVGVPQQHFLANEFVISTWVARFNLFQKSKPNVYPGAVDLSYLCAERNLVRLMPQSVDALLLGGQQRYGSPLVAAIVNSSWEVLSMFLNNTNAHEVDKTMAEVKSKTKFVLSPRRFQDVAWRWTVRNGLEHLSKHLLTIFSKEELFRGDKEDSNALFFAIENASLAIFEHLLALHPSSLHTAFPLRSSIYTAVRLSSRHEYTPRHPLVYAAMLGSEDFVQSCILHGADVNAYEGEFDTALYAALYGGHENIAQMLLEAGADANSQGGDRDNVLSIASKRGYKKIVQMLLDDGAHVNARGKNGSALHVASLKGHEKILQMLLEAGADVNAQGGWYNSALQAASLKGHEKIVQILLEAGADVNAQGGYYDNALYVASSKGYEKIVQMLLEARADVNARGQYYNSALQAASLKGYEKIVQMLLEAGADVNAQGGYYDNALYVASSKGYEKIVQMLLDAGARVEHLAVAHFWDSSSI